ncbi:cobyrinate a,c-diamide synthase [Wansuia hejianensis]|nr:cobyrinate a,c-diamide synthase [Wansuia hejianensis]
MKSTTSKNYIQPPYKTKDYIYNNLDTFLNKSMKIIMFTAPSSNSGKTIITLGIIRALKNKGLDVSPFKTGPDFIDTKYLAMAAKKSAGNLDIHMMGKDGLKDALSMNMGDIAIVEGAMGYFDGIYNTYENSSFDIGRSLNIPAVLVYSPKGEMFSAIPKIKGMVEFKDSNIKAIILNKTSEPMYNLFKEQIEKYIGIEVLGYIPKDEDLEVNTEILGLDLSKGDEFLEYIGEKVSKTIDLDKLMDLCNHIYISPYTYPKKRNIKIAIAYDEAFNFYYKENLNLLENICKVEYFSPLKDKSIPKVDLIYIGGGYPEEYRNKLSQNKAMVKGLKDLGEKGQYIIGESGGLMYLTDSIEESSMVGLLKGKCKTTNKLQRFGYVNIKLQKDCILGEVGNKIFAQEYHKSTLETKSEEIFHINKPMSTREWSCGYRYKNVLGYYQHINFLGNMEVLNHILDKLENKGEVGCI